MKTLLCWFFLMFHSAHSLFLVFGHFWRRRYENMKILRNLCLHFARRNGQEKKQKELNQPKYQKPKDQNMEWTEHLFPEQSSLCKKYANLLGINFRCKYLPIFFSVYFINVSTFNDFFDQEVVKLFNTLTSPQVSG